MKFEITINHIGEVVEGVSQAGKPWKKVVFTGNTTEQYNPLKAFTIFGVEKVDNFLKYNKVGDVVDVSFNVECREYNGKYYTDLQAWKVFKADQQQQPQAQEVADNGNDELPF